MALRGGIRDPATGREWETQIDALLDELNPDEVVELAQLLRAAGRAARQIEAIVTASDRS